RTSRRRYHEGKEPLPQRNARIVTEDLAFAPPAGTSWTRRRSCLLLTPQRYRETSSCPSCAVPECHGISHADPTFREALWDRFFTAAPRPRTPSELLYSDRRLRSRSPPAATILIRKR